MDPITSAAAAGMRARMESLDMLANNLANSSSAGFKADREFYTLYTSPDAEDMLTGELQRQPLIDRPWTDLAQGAMQPTGKSLDLALQGKGFFTATGPNGPVYTRNGNFNLMPDGRVVTQDGNALQLVGGGPLTLNSMDKVDISVDGTVSQQGQIVGQLNLVEFADSSALRKQGGNFVLPADSSTPPLRATPKVYQGSLETSNVSAAEGSIRLVTVMRQYEMLQKAITIGGEMNRKTVEEVAKAG